MLSCKLSKAAVCKPVQQRCLCLAHQKEEWLQLCSARPLTQRLLGGLEAAREGLSRPVGLLSKQNLAGEEILYKHAGNFARSVCRSRPGTINHSLAHR